MENKDQNISNSPIRFPDPKQLKRDIEYFSAMVDKLNQQFTETTQRIDKTLASIARTVSKFERTGLEKELGVVNKKIIR